MLTKKNPNVRDKLNVAEMIINVNGLNKFLKRQNLRLDFLKLKIHLYVACRIRASTK